MTGYFTAPRIAWGPGALEQLSGLGAHRALLVVDPSVASREGVRRVEEELAKSGTALETVAAGADCDRFDEVERLAERARKYRPDWIVALGGGRTMDAAKTVRLLVESPQLSLAAFPPFLELPDTPACRCVAIPTTAGSGAEASATVDLRTADNDPVELSHRALAPDWALVDAAFSSSLSNELRRDGGLEALAQATEAYLSAWANPFSDALAISVVRTVFERLPHALKWSDDPESKEALHFAATLAGLAASNAQRGVGHALARALVPSTGLTYGLLSGLLLPSVLEFDRPSARDRIESLALVLQRPDDRTAVPLPTRLHRLLESVRLPTTLGPAVAERARVLADRSTIVTRALRSPAILANPRVPAARDLELLVDAALTGPPSAS